jgi:CelD/BcsL family acetyltransferase involved in cellulose biosynthesis
VTAPAGKLRVEAIGSFEELKEEWSTLALGARSVFATWEWASTWWRHRGAGRPLLLRACRSVDGHLRVVLPLYLWHARPLRIVRFVGHDQGDELGPIHAPEELQRAADALTDELTRLRPDVFLGEQLPGSENWPSLLGGRRWRLESSPVLHCAGGWDAFLAARSSNFREQLSRRERRLRQRYAVKLRLADDPARLDRELDVLFALHRARWGDSSGFRPEALHREFARLALDRGWLRLWLLELNGEPAAAWYGFRIGGVESYYQAGRDGRFDADSVGFVLLAHTVRTALDDGIDEYRFLRGPEAYKLRFANADSGLETVAVSGSRLGGTAIAAGLAAKQLRTAVDARRATR